MWCTILRARANMVRSYFTPGSHVQRELTTQGYSCRRDRDSVCSCICSRRGQHDHATGMCACDEVALVALLIDAPFQRESRVAQAIAASKPTRSQNALAVLVPPPRRRHNQTRALSRAGRM